MAPISDGLGLLGAAAGVLGARSEPWVRGATPPPCPGARGNQLGQEEGRPEWRQKSHFVGGGSSYSTRQGCDGEGEQGSS